MVRHFTLQHPLYSAQVCYFSAGVEFDAYVKALGAAEPGNLLNHHMGKACLDVEFDYWSGQKVNRQ